MNRDFRIEQPPTLNRFVLESIPLTWAFRKKRLTVFAPLFFFCAFLTGEFFWLNAWNFDSPYALTAALIGFVSVCLLLVLIDECDLRSRNKAKRILVSKPKCIDLAPFKQGHVAWSELRAVHLEPIEGHPDLTKLAITWGRKLKDPKHPPCWEMVLSSREDRQRLIEELENRKAAMTNAAFEVRILDQPHPPKKPRLLPNLWFLSVGFLLLGHGIILTFGSFLALPNKADHEQVKLPPDLMQPARNEAEQNTQQEQYRLNLGVKKAMYLFSTNRLYRHRVTAFVALFLLGLNFLTFGCLVCTWGSLEYQKRQLKQLLDGADDHG